MECAPFERFIGLRCWWNTHSFYIDIFTNYFWPKNERIAAGVSVEYMNKGVIARFCYHLWSHALFLISFFLIYSVDTDYVLL
jgi:hypothetical protein